MIQGIAAMTMIEKSDYQNPTRIWSFLELKIGQEKRVIWEVEQKAERTNPVG